MLVTAHVYTINRCSSMVALKHIKLGFQQCASNKWYVYLHDLAYACIYLNTSMRASCILAHSTSSVTLCGHRPLGFYITLAPHRNSFPRYSCTLSIIVVNSTCQGCTDTCSHHTLRRVWHLLVCRHSCTLKQHTFMLTVSVWPILCLQEVLAKRSHIR